MSNEGTAMVNPNKVVFMAVDIPLANIDVFIAAGTPGLPTAAKANTRPYIVPINPIKVAMLPITPK